MQPIKTMKQSFILMVIAVLACQWLHAQDNVKKKAKIIYSLEQVVEDEFWNTEVYPQPVMPPEQLIEWLGSKVYYPEMAKKYYRSATFLIPLKIDVNGQASAPPDYFTTDEFEQVALTVLTDTNLKWKPGNKNNKMKEMLINVPFSFQITFKENKFYFNVVVFSNFHAFVMDSSENHTSFVKDDQAGLNFINECFLMIPPAWDHDREYGTVTLGFEVDTAGHIAELKVVNSVNKLLDEAAMDFIAKTDGKWTSAWKDGAKAPSYKYFNCYFNDAFFENYLKEDEIKRLRNAFKKQQDKGYKSSYSLAHHDYAVAMDLQAEKKYIESLYFFNRAAKYFVRECNLFYQRAISLHYAGKKQQSCDDLQRVLDIAEIEGFPTGISQQKVEILIAKFCQ